jgi:hypothetical protein
MIAAVRALARKLDDLGVYSVTSATTSTVVAALLIDGTTGASDRKYDGRWIYCNAQQRVVRSGGFIPVTGGLAIRPPWTSTPTSAHTIDLTGFFPVIEEVPGEDISYRSLINRGNTKLLVPDRIAIPITTAQTYSLAAYQWLDRPERLLRVLEPPPSGSLPVSADWRGIRLRLDADTPVLEFDVPYAVATGSISLDVLRPANTWVKVGATWTETSPSSGFVSDTDEVMPNLDDVVKVGLAEALESLVYRSPARPNGDWMATWEVALSAARSLRWYDRGSESPAAQAVPDTSQAAA